VKLVEMPSGNPGGLRLVTLLGEAVIGFDVAHLDCDDGIDEACHVGQTVGSGEYLETVSPIRSTLPRSRAVTSQR